MKSNDLFYLLCDSVAEAMTALTHGYGSSPMHSDLYHIDKIKSNLSDAYSAIKKPDDVDAANYEAALSHINLAIKLHTDNKSPCCRNNTLTEEKA